MATNLANHSTGNAASRTGTDSPEAGERIRAIRSRIDEIDETLIALWQERAALSQQV
ncbi:MAG TPA: chorismate mutase, partial [Micromonospora sp.]